jgi:adenine deaminase
MDTKQLIDVAAGRVPAELVLRNGQIVNTLSCEIHEGDVAIAGGKIVGIGSYEGAEVVDLNGQFICPGFIDGHVHIESSMLSVSEFSKTVVRNGTVAVVADPHEIANVMGLDGIRYMLASSKYCPIQVYIMVSSCVPASHLESAGAELSAIDIESMMTDKWVIGLGEMMNYPGVVAGDAECLAKIAAAGDRPVDGHAPELGGRDLCAYVVSGVRSDHECMTAGEALEKLRMGLYIMIREGSQARNLDALLPLVRPDNVERFMFVVDDKDIVDLQGEGHIDSMIRRAVASGIDPIHAIKMATINTANYFGLEHLGAVAPGRDASIVVLDDLKSCRVQRTYNQGKLVYCDSEVFDRDADRRKQSVLRSSVNVAWIEPDHFKVRVEGTGEARVHVIEVLEDRIDTERTVETLPIVDGELHADAQRDICKISVIERHHASGRVAHGFVRGFGFSGGAIASSVAHDSHNLVIAGTNDRDMYHAAVHLVKIRGGFCVVDDGKVLADVPLSIGGLMTDVDADTLHGQLDRLHEAAAQLNGSLRRPFMALSFLSLSVIGKLKLTDQGLVDVDQFRLIDLLADE